MKAFLPRKFLPWSLYAGGVWFILTSYELIHSKWRVYCFSKSLNANSTPKRCLRFIHLGYQLEFCSQFSSFCLWSIFSWYLKSFDYIWNLTSVILNVGDIETNPGPRRLDTNPVLCTICSKRINKVPNLKAAAICCDQYCKTRYYLHCNGLTLSQN